MAKNDFAEDLKAKNKPKTVEYHYRKVGKKGRKRDNVTYSILPMLADKIERWAWHSRKDRSEIVEAILLEALKDKDFEPIPEDKPLEL